MDHTYHPLSFSPSGRYLKTDLNDAIDDQDVTEIHRILTKGQKDGEINTELINHENWKWTPLMIATKYYREDNGTLFRQLLAAGADINLTNDKGENVLMLAVGNSNSTSSNDAVKIILDKISNTNGSLNGKNRTGKTALMIAAASAGNTSTNEAVQMLIDAGADVNVTDQMGYTALMLAARIFDRGSNNVVITRMLINAGADVNNAGKYGNTALIFAAQDKNVIMKSQDVVRLLVKAKANVNWQNNRGETALMLANGDDKVVVLLEAGADPTLVDHEGFNTYYYHRENIDVLDLLIQRDPYTSIDECQQYGLLYCVKESSKNIWSKMKQNIDRLATQYSRSGDIRLPKDIWKLILLRQRQQQLCKNLLSYNNKYILIGMADMLNIPVTERMTKENLCNLVSRQISWGGLYSQTMIDNLNDEEKKREIMKAAQLLGINTNQRMDNIIKDITDYYNKKGDNK